MYFVMFVMNPNIFLGAVIKIVNGMIFRITNLCYLKNVVFFNFKFRKNFYYTWTGDYNIILKN